MLQSKIPIYIYNIYSSSYNIIRVIKSQQKTWAGHLARTGDRISTYRNLVGNSEEKSNLEELGEDGRIILKWVIKKCARETWTGLIWLRTGTSSGLL